MPVYYLPHMSKTVGIATTRHLQDHCTGRRFLPEPA